MGEERKENIKGKKIKKIDLCTIAYRTAMVAFAVGGLWMVADIYVNVTPPLEVEPIEVDINTDVNFPEDFNKTWHKAFEKSITKPATSDNYGNFYLTGEKARITWTAPDYEWSFYENAKANLTDITGNGYKDISPGEVYEFTLGDNQDIPGDTWYYLHEQFFGLNSIYIVVYLYY